jgi:hypothetical protein
LRRPNRREAFSFAPVFMWRFMRLMAKRADRPHALR